MAKEDKGKLKIRFFEVELEGGNHTLVESIKTAAALARGNGGPALPAPTRQVKALPGQQQAELQLNDGNEPQDDEGVVTEVESSSEDKPKKNRAYPTPEIIDIDLTSGPVPLEEFCKSKNPSEDNKKYLAIAAWLKEHRNTTPIGINHIWTCFRLMGWGVQKDMGQPFRSMKKIGWFKSGAERGTYEITHIGLDVVRKMSAGG